MRQKYEAMKRLLHADIQCHEQMASIQELLHGEKREDFSSIRTRVDIFSSHVLDMITELENMVPARYRSLRDYHKKFDFYTRFLLAPPQCESKPPFILFQDDIDETSRTIGDKAKNLAILKKNLHCTVPRSYTVISSAFHALVEKNHLRKEIDKTLKNLYITDQKSLHSSSRLLQRTIREAVLPDEIERAITDGYDHLDSNGSGILEVAVRSSALNEDGEYSFAGQYDTRLRVTRKTLCQSYKEILASKYSPESLYYRISHGIMDEEAAMSVLVQEMVSADWSGILYTGPTKLSEADNDTMSLHITSGLGDKLANGEVTATKIEINRKALNAYSIEHHNQSGLPVEIILKLLTIGVAIEHHFSSPQDIEWAYSNKDGLFLLQARPLHQVDDSSYSVPTISEASIIVDDGECASSGIGAGPVFFHPGQQPLEELSQGSVLVTRNTPPEYTQYLHLLSAVIAENGSGASHFATVAREFSVPTLTGIDHVFSYFQEGEPVTVNGYDGKVYRGIVETLLNHKPQLPKTKYHTVLQEALSFITPLELIDPDGANFNPEGCRSMHDIIRFCHEKCLRAMFAGAQPGSGRGAVKLQSDIMLDVYLFDVGGGIRSSSVRSQHPSVDDITSMPFHGLWRGLSHPGVQWKQKPFDWEGYEKIELTGAVPPKQDSFAFASYAVIGCDYLHFHIRFGYHFTIVDVLLSEKKEENHCMLRFAGGGGGYDNKALRILFLSTVLADLGFDVKNKGDLLEGKLHNLPSDTLLKKLDYLGRLLGASKLMDMILEDEEMVRQCVADFHNGVYSFSEEG